MIQAIDNFRGKYSPFSNFSPHTVLYNNILYPTAEHAFAAAKATNKEDHDWIASAPTATSAKHRGGPRGENGRTIQIRADWDKAKDLIMFEIVRAKFLQNEGIANLLLETENAWLIEGNWWHDDYWGMVRGADGQWIGQNKLGAILMLVREILKIQREILKIQREIQRKGG